ncbi:response regulator [Umezawaea tangerina]|uniref:LuxR family two component transcriptional regulator n=1 Tax=Umezawaea tangerina TaxID=84725 RepID=A0A2T0SGD5_9PSEU|nr:response regulator transcription factor [Umezawaea tangerina]PRY32465.1 LuxR family two component transcriptional regulator [Umezawaea tangerina]
MIRVLIADDEELMRVGLRTMLEADDDISVVAEARNGDEAVAEARRHRPTVVLMDIRMPQSDGLTATKALAALAEPPKVIVLTTFDLDEYVHAALRAGAVGFLLKDTPPRDLIKAVHVVADGQAMLSPSVTRNLISAFVERDSPVGDDARNRLKALTDREREVLALVGRGLSNTEIGEQLHNSQATVKAHMSRLLTKLDLSNRVQAAILAHDANLVEGG